MKYLERKIFPQVLTIIWIIFYGLVSLTTAKAAIFTVGNAVNCSHTTIQAALNSASANAEADTIRISNQLSYSAQAITIGGGDFTLEGGYSDCATNTPTSSTTISGLGGSTDSVFKISSDGVRYFKRLLITRGDAIRNDGRGGGIRFDGTGDLILEDVSVDQNIALSGGGVYFRSTGGAATLLINNNSSISRNTATMDEGHGGGITITGNARLIMSANNTAIFSNLASGANSRGGGIAVFGPARADIGSPGLGPIGAIFDNEAEFGGGISAYASSVLDADNRALVRMFTTVANRPVRLHGNRARSLGGAFFARPESDGSIENAGLCLLDAQVDNNSAGDGAAFYLDTNSNGIGLFDVGGLLSINAGGFVCGGPESTAALGAVRCTPSLASCNVIENNRAINVSNGTPTTGAIILGQTESELILRRVRFLNNEGGSVIDLREAKEFDLDLSLLAANTVTSNLLKANSGTTSFRVVNTSMSNNSIGDSRVVSRAGSGAIEFKNNLINQPGNLTLNYGGNISSASSDIAYNVSIDTTTLPPNSSNFGGPIRLIDPARGDYRQRIGSRGVDVLPVISGNDLDLDGRPFDVLNPIYEASTSAANSRDAGAFERQIADPWLVNGSFDGDLNQWVSSTPTLTSYSTLNAVGSLGGSVAFSRLATNGDPVPLAFNVVRQCFNVPAAGVYNLTAKARAPGSVLVSHDLPFAQLFVRYNADHCSGPIDQIVSGNLPNDASFAVNETAIQAIISAAQFGPNTSIEVLMNVEQDIQQTTMNAGFDDVRLGSGSLSNFLFSDGFED